MKRTEIIKKLMLEGFNEKTLVNMNDKQLKLLSDRILTENTVMISKKSPTYQQDVESAKQSNKTIETYESELLEDKNLSIDTVNTRIFHKIKNKKGKNCEDLIDLAKQINGGKLPEKIKKLIDDKPNLNEMKNWVNGLVESKFSIATKGEIMEILKSKLDEQEIAEPITKPKTPKTKPGERPKPKHPLQPGPGVNPKPKASLPEFLKFNEIKGSEIAEPIIKPKTPKTKPGEKPRPKHPLKPGPGINPKPKAGIKNI